jgi:hypothetical protein
MSTGRRYIGQITPSLNDGVNTFVFGSNLRGIHGAGAAAQARLNWGASYGMAVGYNGNSYAIPTKDHPHDRQGLPLAEISIYVNDFIGFAQRHPGQHFLVTPIGTGYAGYSHADIAHMFRDAPSNVVLPEVWRELLEGKP